MFNCYVVVFAGSPFAYFRTEVAAENFVTMFNANRSPSANMVVEGRYIKDITF